MVEVTGIRDLPVSSVRGTEHEAAAEKAAAEGAGAHIESGADITCVCTESGQFVENATYFTVNEAGRITETRCAPHKASGCRSLEIYLLSRDLLIPLWTSAPRRTNTAFAAMCSAPWATSSTCALSCGTDLPRSCARCRNTMSAACSS